MSQYRVKVSKDYLVFPAAHFITYRGQCEPLHGHNYRASVVVEGDLDENDYVLDFGELKRIMREVIADLDHRMLLPLDNPRLTITQDADSISVQYEDRRYVFPRVDVALLPIPNTTSEVIARFLTQRLREELEKCGAEGVTGITMEVEESFGQSASYRESLR